jgi:hypothetical protein
VAELEGALSAVRARHQADSAAARRFEMMAAEQSDEARFLMGRVGELQGTVDALEGALERAKGRNAELQGALGYRDGALGH